ncbi:hypothetical protein D3C85_1744940 [compost metagenome]
MKLLAGGVSMTSNRKSNACLDKLILNVRHLHLQASIASDRLDDRRACVFLLPNQNYLGSL